MNHLLLLSALIGILAIMCLGVSAQENGNGRHSRMFAIPAPENVKIDGNLDEWDRSGELETYVMAATRNLQYGKMSVMYDKDALYIGGEVHKPILITNRHSPESNGDRAWDADSIQFRLTVDPSLGYPVVKTTSDKESSDQIVHLLMWYYTDREEPCLQAGTSMAYHPLPGAVKFGVMPKEMYQAAYKLTPDKKGYTFEYRIPWKTLGAAHPPQAGDITAATYQFNFGRTDGLMTLRDAGWAYDLKGAPGFAYQNAGCWGKLIFSKTGNLPKELVEDNQPPTKPQPCSFTYNLPKNGEVSIALYNDKKEVVRVLTASSPRQAGHVTENWDGLDEMEKLLPAGNYTWKGLYHQPITTQYVMSLHNSGQPAYKTDDNTGAWGGDHGVPSAACAVADGMLLAWNYNECGSGLIKTNFEGKKQWGIINSQGFLASDGIRIFADTHEFGTGLRCFDIKDGRPLSWGNGAAVLTPPPGGDAKKNTVTGLTYNKGKLYVAFKERQLVAVYDSVKGDLLETVAILSPGALSACNDGAIIAISNNEIVKIIDNKTVPFITEHLDNPSGVAASSNGTIYVANQGKLQHITVYTASGIYRKSIGKKGGRPLIGRFDPSGMLSPTSIAIDTKDRLWVMESIDSPKRVSVWNTKTGKLYKEFFGAAHYSSFIWMDPMRPKEIYCDGVIWKVDLKRKKSAPFATCWRSTAQNIPGGFSTHTGGFRPFTAKNGRQYGLDIGTKILYMRDGDIFKPIIMPKGAGLIWVDKNNDQTIQPEEITNTEKGQVSTISYIDDYLTIWAKGQRFHPIRIEKDGRPLYDFTAPDTFADIKPGGLDKEDGSLYAFDNGYDISGSLKGYDYGRFNADGTVQWGYRGRISWPNGLQLPPQRSGKIWGPTELLGTAGDFTGFATYYGCHHIYTRRDGLPVAMLFRDPRVALGKLGPDIIASENYNGQLVIPQGMKRFFALGGDQDGRISEVFGLDTVKYLPGGTYNLTEADVQKAADALRDYQTTLTKSRKLIIVRGENALKLSPSIEKVLTPDQSFKVRLAYDTNNLYVQYTITTPVPFVNAASDPQTIFKGGNLLDIQLATEASADQKRTTPAPGDIRILISRRDGKPYAVIYRPKVKGFTGTPIVLSSPTGKESFDAIETINNIKLDYQQTTDGFITTAVLPLNLLGWTPQPGTKIRLDLGYIFGNNTGMKATGRAYWANTGFAAGVLNDIPNESRLVPNEWVEAEVE